MPRTKEGREYKRLVVELHPNQDYRLGLECSATGRSKTDIVRSALDYYLTLTRHESAESVK